MNKVIIAGSRSCPEDDVILFNKVNSILRNIEVSEIVSGTARGADKFGEWYAELSSIPVKKFPADWSLGKKAGYLRNKQMSEYGTHLIAIIDLSVPSKGTRLMVKLAKDNGLEIRIIKI